MIAGPDDARATLDPWCTVTKDGHGTVLFGFATHHHRTGGLAWTRSSPLVTLDGKGTWARTESGTLFALGECLHGDDIAVHGVEARLAFRLLLDEKANPGCIAPSLADRTMGEWWLTACKVARHLGLTPPPPCGDETVAFLHRHGPDYQRRRASSWFQA